MAKPDPTDLPQPGLLDERRAHPRLTLRADVTVQSQDNVLAGMTEDLSLGGAFVASLAPPAIGEIVRLELVVEGHDRVLLDAEVRWHREDEEGLPCGCGLRFVELTDSQRARLAELCEGLPQAPLLDVEAW